MHHKEFAVLLAGGGTAGHVEPALAVGRWIADNYPKVKIEFLGTENGVENQLVPEAGFVLRKITKAPMPRSLKVSTFFWPLKFLRSLIQTWKYLRNIDLLVGFGGYVCSAAYIIARIKRIPIIAHEANAVPGWANKLGARLGAKVLISFSYTRKFGKKFRDAEFVGIPLRKEIVSASALNGNERSLIRQKKADEWGVNPKLPIVIVFGGSLGSQHMNHVIAECSTLMAEHGIQIIHAVGRNNELPKESQGYKPIPYFEDLPEAYCAADLVISRSGAVTCHELLAVGVYALLVPLSVGNGEQRFNGQEIVGCEAGTMISNGDFTADWLSQHILGLVATARKFNASPHVSKVPLDAVNRIGKIISEHISNLESNGRKG
jgi:UDP-N-acetylglucosamine--N-acetylmuramyl-(pentapeptide) pyrophosphoryl-undecaprenol N-acetylglucosamine transferase